MRCLAPSPDNFGFVSELTSVNRISEGLHFARIKDAVFVSKQPPLLLLFYDFVLSNFPLRLFNAAVDALGSFALAHLFRLNAAYEKLTEESTERVMDSRTQPHKITAKIMDTDYALIIGTAYFANPISIAIGCSPSTQPLIQLLIIISVVFSLRRNIPASMTALSLSTYMIWWPLALLPSLLLTLGRPAVPQEPHRPKLSPANTAIFGLVIFTSALALLVLVSSYTISPSHPNNFEWPLCYYHWATFQDLTPNVGLYWYFFTQIFSRFRTYFVVIFNTLPGILVAPILIRLKEIPTAATISLLALFNVLAPYPTFGNVTFSLLFMSTSPRTLVRLRFISVFCLIALPVPSILMVVFWRMWAIEESGNGNYVYFQQLAYTIFAGLIALDFLSASVSRVKALKITRKPSSKVKQS
ncbi:hypothetical protein TL16_g11742 [Triparma laevis f. inornata]|uniref:GPI transamidase subunit PIG-U n=1 Tax=Triparma laevis f. inornata TaxID=1714386 RepID=A0A9W7BMI9_9STRA|nr:hypothetical protein TL16_g11742 [Triparma laevis f. inornata]